MPYRVIHFGGRVADETIFIVDDDESVRRSLTRLIRSAGWNVEVYSSGIEFLARLPFEGRGCAILDLTMSGMTGLETRDQMAARNFLMPIIFLTGGRDITPEIPMNPRREEVAGFLTKPVDAAALFHAIQQAMKRQALPGKPG